MKKYSDAKQIGKYLAVQKLNLPNRKTEYYRVYGDNYVLLGDIGWYGRWRQYVFTPQNLTFFHNGCLTDLADFLTKLNREHREHLKRMKTLKEAKKKGEENICFKCERWIDHSCRSSDVCSSRSKCPFGRFVPRKSRRK